METPMQIDAIDKAISGLRDLNVQFSNVIIAFEKIDEIAKSMSADDWEEKAALISNIAERCR